MNENQKNATRKDIEYIRDTMKDNFYFMTEYFQKLELMASEREFNFTLSITSITVAFLSLILPLIYDKGIQISRLTIISLIFASFFGFVCIAFSNFLDSKLIQKNKKRLLPKYEEFALLATELYAGSFAAEMDNIFYSKVEKYNSSIKEIDIIKKDLKTENSKYHDLFALLNWIFIWSFVVGYVGILLEIVINFI